jgi:hypothetical protein
MKKNVLAAVLLFLPAMWACADIVDDFKVGAVAVGGSASFSYFNDGLTFDPSREANSWSISVAPSLSIFLFDFVDCTVTPDLQYAHAQADPANVSDRVSYGVSLAVGYYILVAPSSPFVLHASLGVQLSLSPGLPGTVGGVPFSDDSLIGALAPFVTFAFYNFITQQIALDIGITPQVSFPQLMRDVAGNGVSRGLNPSFTLNASIGLTYVFAQEKRAPVTARSILR